MRTGSLRGAPLAGLVSAYHAVHAGPCSVICVASARRKKLPTRKCGSAYRNCATCSQECCGADGTALNTCCIGPSGEAHINSEPCAATIASADQPCLHSIYNCSIRHHLVVPAVITRLVSPDQEKGCPGGIEGVKDTIRPAFVLNSQLAHVAERRAFHAGALRVAKRWPSLHQHQHHALDAVLFRLGEVFVPGLELVRDLDLICHGCNISRM